MVGFGAIIYAFADEVAFLFIHDEAVVAEASRLMRYMSPSFCFTGVAIVLGGAISGAGKTLQAMLISMAALWIGRIGVAYLLAPTLGTTGVWVSFPSGAVLGAAIALLYVRFGDWRRATIARQVGVLKRPGAEHPIDDTP